ncbi:hypothetical protein ACFLX5_00535 [Chloroflexota bacterium]
MTRNVPLHELCYWRSGDKGDVSNIGLMALSEANYEILKREVTPQRVKEHFKGWVKGEVTVYDMPNLMSLELVLAEGLGGGATRTLRFDQTGKGMGNALVTMEVEVPDDYVLVTERPF